jgi:hypothetical protein
MQNLPSIVTLRERLRTIKSYDAFRGPEEAYNELRRDVDAVVDDLRALEWPPEHIVVGIKEIAQEAGLTGTKAWLRVGGRQMPRDEFVGQIVRWGVQRYVGD